MDLDRLLELNNNYSNSHNKVVDLLQTILDKGELTEGDYEEVQDSYSKNEDNYNELNKAENDYTKSDLEMQLEILRNTKIDLDVDSVLDLLTNGGRTSALYKDENGNIVLDAAKIEELNQVKVLIDESNKRISSIIADTEVEKEDGTKVKLKVLFTTLDQKVDGITSTVGQIQGVADDANSKADGAINQISQISQKVDSITSTVQDNTTSIKNGVTSVANQYYVSTSKTELAGGSWSMEPPTNIPEGKYLWIRTTYKKADGTTSIGNAVCTSGVKGDKGDTGATGADGKGIANMTSYIKLVHLLQKLLQNGYLILHLK